MAGLAEQIYKHSPVMLQHVMVSAYGWYWKRLRFGGMFQRECEGFRQREYFTTEEWKRYTEQRLREVLVTAFERVPHYQQAWKGVVTVEQLRKFTLDDLQALPPLEKGIARDKPHSLLVDGVPRKNHLVFHTSGSTGTPVATYWLPSEIQRSLALRESRSCKFAGVSFQLPRATFSGRIVVPDPDSKGPYHRFNWFEKQVYFSAFHLRPDIVKTYLDALKRHNTQWITGYSNSIYQLAQMALDAELDIPQLKAVITTSEKVTPKMRNVIEHAFSTRVFEEYATVEDPFYVCENEFGQKLINPDAGILEIVDDQCRPLPLGEQGEVLVTSFIRGSQPFIRYRVGDEAILSDEPARCGRHMPVLKEVVGRIEDTVYGPDGRRMVRFHGIFIDQPHIREGQIVQEGLDHIRVRIIPKSDFSKTDEDDVVSRIQQRLTARVNVTIELVDRIELTSAGKFRAVICNLSPEERQRAQQFDV